MPDFWQTSGFHLLDRDEAGNLEITDDLIRAYFMRPELHPVEESCAAERALHAELVNDPRRSVEEADLRKIADSDVVENYRHMLKFRDLLTSSGTIERCYLAVFERGSIEVPPLFVDQLTHIVLRGILDGIDDPIRVRAAEILFREQRVTIQDGAIMVADSEIVERRSGATESFSLAGLLEQGESAAAPVELDVLTPDNAANYWQRSDHFDTVLDLRFSSSGLDALCRVLESWVEHFLRVDVAIQPVQQITDERWVYHIGLDTEATRILNDLYKGQTVGEDRMARILSLFRLEFRSPSLMRSDIAGRPVYLAMAMTTDGLLRLKPQNLLLNLPVAGAS